MISNTRREDSESVRRQCIDLAREDTEVPRRVVVIAMSLGFALFLRPKIAADIEKAMADTMAAIGHGKQGYFSVLRAHAEAPLRQLEEVE